MHCAIKRFTWSKVGCLIFLESHGEICWYFCLRCLGTKTENSWGKHEDIAETSFCRHWWGLTGFVWISVDIYMGSKGNLPWSFGWFQWGKLRGKLWRNHEDTDSIRYDSWSFERFWMVMKKWTMIDNGDWEFIWIYGLNLWILWGSRTVGSLPSPGLPSPITGILQVWGYRFYYPRLQTRWCGEIICYVTKNIP